jgi:adenylosuccinate lyase
MIERYTRERMGRLFTDQAKMEAWLRVEIAVSEVLAERGEIPGDALHDIKRHAAVDVERAKEIEKTVNHDVIAFVTAAAEKVGESGRYLHLGLTSSDVLDTSLALVMQEAFVILLEEVDAFLAVLREQAERWAGQPMVGRTHGVNAEPTTFGFKIAGWFAEMRRHRERLERAREQAGYGKLSGAVGSCSQLPPDVERDVLHRLGLEPEPAATQVVPRDRHAEVTAALALLGAGLERIATEIRHLQRTEVREVEEPFRRGQKGSSAMPHKRNPIACENVTGLARVLRANAQAALENVALWHERDISHSSVERVVLPDSFILADFMVARMTRVVRDLHVYPESMEATLERSRGLIYSQSLLSALIRTGLSREQAYEWVQQCSMKVWDREEPSLVDACLADERIVGRLGREGVEAACNRERMLQHVPELLARALR